MHAEQQLAQKSSYFSLNDVIVKPKYCSVWLRYQTLLEVTTSLCSSFLWGMVHGNIPYFSRINWKILSIQKGRWLKLLICTHFVLTSLISQTLYCFVKRKQNPSECVYLKKNHTVPNPHPKKRELYEVLQLNSRLQLYEILVMERVLCLNELWFVDENAKYCFK